MALLTEGKHAGEFLVSEASGFRSRETVTILSGQDVSAGDVLGKVTKGAATPAAVAGNTGNGAFGAVTVSAGAKVGVYKVVFIEPAANAGRFTVEDPDGITIGVGTVAVAFSAGGLAFTIADGATDFVSGDSFTITVAAGSGKYVLIDPEGTDGRETAAGILWDNVDATGGDVEAVAIVRDAEVNADELGYSDADAGEITTINAQLATLGIIVREAI